VTRKRNLRKEGEFALSVEGEKGEIMRSNRQRERAPPVEQLQQSSLRSSQAFRSNALKTGL
jgi:hypothetical protein